jgi:hypothetical protein
MNSMQHVIVFSCSGFIQASLCNKKVLYVWSMYDRIWFPGPYKQEIFILTAQVDHSLNGKVNIKSFIWKLLSFPFLFRRAEFFASLEEFSAFLFHTYSVKMWLVMFDEVVLDNARRRLNMKNVLLLPCGYVEKMWNEWERGRERDWNLRLNADGVGENCLRQLSCWDSWMFVSRFCYNIWVWTSAVPMATAQSHMYVYC